MIAIAPVHVSGHASQEEQKLLLNLVRPKHFMPIHGELRQLKRHAELAEEVGMAEENILVVENGQVVELDGGTDAPRRTHPRRLCLRGRRVHRRYRSGVMREREQLARNGILLIDISVDKFSGRLAARARDYYRGFSVRRTRTLIPEVRKHA